MRSGWEVRLGSASGTRLPWFEIMGVLNGAAESEKLVMSILVSSNGRQVEGHVRWCLSGSPEWKAIHFKPECFCCFVFLSWGRCMPSVAIYVILG